MKIRSIPLKRNKFTLYPLSDVHWPRHDHGKLKEWKRVVMDDPSAMVTLGGDLFDFARGKYRMHLEAFTADSNSRRAVDDPAYSLVEDMAAFLKPIAPRVIGTCVGNHFWRFADGRVSDQELAIQMGIAHTFVGALGLFRMDVTDRAKVKVALHHDAGRKGGTASADMLAFQHWSHAVAADIYIAGHTHRQYAGIYQAKITVDDDQDRVSDRKLVFMRSGAFLKGYTESVIDPEKPFIPDYAEVAMLPPSVLGIISVGVEVGVSGKVYYELRQRTL